MLHTELFQDWIGWESAQQWIQALPPHPLTPSPAFAVTCLCDDSHSDWDELNLKMA